MLLESPLFSESESHLPKKGSGWERLNWVINETSDLPKILSLICPSWYELKPLDLKGGISFCVAKTGIFSRLVLNVSDYNISVPIELYSLVQESAERKETNTKNRYSLFFI